MAANKFATMVHNNTNKLTLILVYTFLEWVLILFLLLNSLFSYLIIKFADFFGLKPPCLICTRLDHVFDPNKGSVCEIHAKEISQLSYCLNHKKLVESESLCEDCLVFSRKESKGLSKNLSFLRLVRKLGVVQSCGQGVCENAQVESLNCSCCGVSLDYGCFDSDLYSSYVLVKTSSWDVLENGKIGNDDVDSHFEKRDDLCDGEKCLGNDEIVRNDTGCVEEKGVEGEFFTVSLDDERKEFREGEDVNVGVVHELEEKNETLIMLDDERSEFREGEDVNVGVVHELEEKKETLIMLDDERREFREGEDVNVGGARELEEKNETLIMLDDERREFREGEDGDVGVVHELEENNETLIMKDKVVQVFIDEEEEEVSSEHLEYFLEYNGHGLVPFELIDPLTEELKLMGAVQRQDDDTFKDEERGLDSDENGDVFVKNGGGLMEVDDLIDFDVSEEAKVAVLDSMEVKEDENSLVFPLVDFSSRDATDVQEMDEATREEDHSNVQTDREEAAPMVNNENESDVSIGTEIPDLDEAGETQNHEFVHSHASQTDEKLSVHGEQTVDLLSLSAQSNEHSFNMESSFHMELNDAEEDKAPNTPTSASDYFKKLLFVEKRDSVTEDSFDGVSVTSELEGGDGVVTVECLKTALRAERKALQVLYAELDEERSASAVATNQTMAMINRLQEEKSAMQMEALHYQRMMEEQSEYDQEALQLLNELMVKREKEKRELEKELEVYKKKLFDYESKERMKKQRNSGFSPASCINAEESEEFSVDLNQEGKEEDGNYGGEDYLIHNTPVSAVLKLEESLTDFEVERLSILEQLKGLEEKLMIMDDDEEEHFEDYGVHGNENGHLNGETNGHANGLTSNGNGLHHENRRYRGQKGRSLLPLFNAIGDENEDIMMSNGNGNGTETNGARSSYDSNFKYENKKFVVEEEVNNLYERLQALEADREFLKHCISSVKKGDKGVDLLQEILEHLRDLRNVELRARNSTDTAIM